MTEWSLSRLLSDLHQDIQNRLAMARQAIGHPGAKGDVSERIWIELLGKYLPKRYQVANAFVVDSNGVFSDQIDVLIFDRQYTPFVFQMEGTTVVPAESVYAVFEAKQSVNAQIVDYAQKKVQSVRRLHRTSLPIPHAGKDPYPPKPPIPIIGGVLALESDWKPALGEAFQTALLRDIAEGRLDLGCVASHGHFQHDPGSGGYAMALDGKPATAFLLKLISQLQFSGTVPMIDVEAYATWLAK